MKSSGITAMAATLVLLQFTVPAFAHTKLADTLPKSGAVLERSPPAIEFHFEHSVSLTSVILIEAGKTERALVFTPIGNAATFRIEEPRLGPGHNEIRWKALGGDGHIVSGTLVYEIKAAEAKTG
jgi:copper resistance protein C